jgi:hypothetical protein
MTNYFYGSCYKYRRFGGPDSAAREHLANLILKRRMMFSSPDSFNDPYDCTPVFIRGSKPAEDRVHIRRAWVEGSELAGVPKLPSDEIEGHVSNVMKQLSTPEGAAAHFKPFLHDHTGVFCMSQDWRLLTQWAYYADGGKGLCLEYAVNPAQGFDCVFEVEYSNERPRVNIVRLLAESDYRTEALFAAVTRKATDWAHEREVRALQNKPGVVIHPPRMLAAVMIGIAAVENDVQWLLDILRGENIRVPVYQTQLSPESFTLQRRQISG